MMMTSHLAKMPSQDHGNSNDNSNDNDSGSLLTPPESPQPLDASDDERWSSSQPENETYYVGEVDETPRVSNRGRGISAPENIAKLERVYQLGESLRSPRPSTKQKRSASKERTPRRTKETRSRPRKSSKELETALEGEKKSRRQTHSSNGSTKSPTYTTELLRENEDKRKSRSKSSHNCDEDTVSSRRTTRSVSTKKKRSKSVDCDLHMEDVKGKKNQRKSVSRAKSLDLDTDVEDSIESRPRTKALGLEWDQSHQDTEKTESTNHQALESLQKNSSLDPADDDAALSHKTQAKREKSEEPINKSFTETLSSHRQSDHSRYSGGIFAADNNSNHRRAKMQAIRELHRSISPWHRKPRTESLGLNSQNVDRLLSGSDDSVQSGKKSNGSLSNEAVKRSTAARSLSADDLLENCNHHPVESNKKSNGRLTKESWGDFHKSLDSGSADGSNWIVEPVEPVGTPSTRSKKETRDSLKIPQGRSNGGSDWTCEPVEPVKPSAARTKKEARDSLKSPQGRSNGGSDWTCEPVNLLRPSTTRSKKETRDSLKSPQGRSNGGSDWTCEPLEPVRSSATRSKKEGRDSLKSPKGRSNGGSDWTCDPVETLTTSQNYLNDEQVESSSRSSRRRSKDDLSPILFTKSAIKVTDRIEDGFEFLTSLNEKSLESRAMASRGQSVASSLLSSKRKTKSTDSLQLRSINGQSIASSVKTSTLNQTFDRLNLCRSPRRKSNDCLESVKSADRPGSSNSPRRRSIDCLDSVTNTTVKDSAGTHDRVNLFNTCVHSFDQSLDTFNMAQKGSNHNSLVVDSLSGDAKCFDWTQASEESLNVSLGWLNDESPESSTMLSRSVDSLSKHSRTHHSRSKNDDDLDKRKRRGRSKDNNHSSQSERTKGKRKGSADKMKKQVDDVEIVDVNLSDLLAAAILEEVDSNPLSKPAERKPRRNQSLHIRDTEPIYKDGYLRPSMEAHAVRNQRNAFGNLSGSELNNWSDYTGKRSKEAASLFVDSFTRDSHDRDADEMSPDDVSFDFEPCRRPK